MRIFERVKAEKVDSRDPDIKSGVLGISIIKAIAREAFFEPEESEKETSPITRIADYIQKNIKNCESGFDLDNLETFRNGCRDFEDRIERATDEGEKERLTKDSELYKKEWDKQKKRETEDKEIRDQRIQLIRERWGF